MNFITSSTAYSLYPFSTYCHKTSLVCGGDESSVMTAIEKYGRLGWSPEFAYTDDELMTNVGIQKKHLSHWRWQLLGTSQHYTKIYNIRRKHKMAHSISKRLPGSNRWWGSHHSRILLSEYNYSTLIENKMSKVSVSVSWCLSSHNIPGHPLLHMTDPFPYLSNRPSSTVVKNICHHQTSLPSVATVSESVAPLNTCYQASHLRLLPLLENGGLWPSYCTGTKLIR